MDILINILAVIGALCVLCTIGLIVLIIFGSSKNQPDEEDEIISLIKENKHLKKQLERRNLISIAQGIQIELLTEEKKKLNQDVIDDMLTDFYRDEQTLFNT